MLVGLRSVILAACLAACATGDRPAPDGGTRDGSVGRDDGAIGVDRRALPDGGGDAEAGDDAGGPDDAAVSDGGALDAGRGPMDAGPPDAGPPDAGRPDAGPPVTDAGGARFLLGAPGADCDTTCATIGLSCGGPGTVGLDCGMHGAVTGCSLPGYFIYRDHPMMPPPHCRDSWGTSEICSNNYNIYNSFCCLCLGP